MFRDILYPGGVGGGGGVHEKPVEKIPTWLKSAKGIGQFT